MTDTKSVTRLREELNEILRLCKQGKTVIITRYGRLDVVVLDAAMYESIKACGPQTSELGKRGSEKV